MSLKPYKNFVVIWSIIYIAVAMIGRFATYNKEIYPFFRWSLYSKTPNKVEMPFVMVSKIGDSILQKPENISELNKTGYLTVVDAKLNVSNFYSAIKKDEDINTTILSKMLPNNSEYTLYVKELDLSQKDYKSTEKIKTILSVKNNKVIKINE